MTATVPLSAHVQSPSLDELVTLFDIDATAITGEIYRVTPMAYGNPATGEASAAVVWRGYTYSPIPLQSDGWEMNGKGTLPSPTLKVSNISLAFSSLNLTYGDLLGAIVTRHRTWKRYLDGQADADPNVEMPPDVYKINRKSAQNKLFVEWELAPGMDQEGRLIPGRPVLQGACTHIYRRWDATAGAFDYSKATCPYVGASYFDFNGNAVAAPAQDLCSKRITTGCKKRFSVLPTRAFPGVARIRQ